MENKQPERVFVKGTIEENKRLAVAVIAATSRAMSGGIPKGQIVAVAATTAADKSTIQ